MKMMNKRSWVFLSAACLVCAALFAPAFGTEPAEKKLVLFLGDSLTAGYGLDPAMAFPALVQEKIDQAGLPFEVLNAGLSGETSAGGVRRIEWILRRPIAVMVLELGANDGLRGVPVEKTRSNLAQIIQTTRQKSPEVKIILAGMMVPPNLGRFYAESFRSLYTGLAEEYELELIPFLLDGVAGQAELNQADGIHPTAAGHKIVAENVWRVLEPALRKISKSDP